MIDETLDVAFVKKLDGMAIGDITDIYGPPDQTVTDHYRGKGYWKPGDGEPVVNLADDPAAAQAAGRCMASRTRYASAVGGGSIHPNVCGWCDYPAETLLQALDHAAFMARYVSTEFVVWVAKAKGGGTYARPTGRGETKARGRGVYDNPVWERFFALDIPLRRKAIEAAASVESGVS